MNEPHDPNRTVDVPSTPGGNEPHAPGHTVDPASVADSLDAGLAAGFGLPRSSLGAMRPVLLKEAEGDSAHVVKPHSDAMPSPQQTGDRYQLQGEIARGGMGAVLRGRDVDLGRDLAIKVLLEKHAANPEVARRFIEEAQIGGQLQHPGVVPVYDIGRFGERPFFTMKLVKGQTLAALLRERSQPGVDTTSLPSEMPRLLDITLKVAQAMAYAHAKGVIHRDLKPGNVMVGAFGEVQVMDWGLAKVLAEGGVADEERASRQHQPEEGTQIRTARSTGSAETFGTQTEAGSLLGTPAYMPPEQANGDVAHLDRRADVFGLGAILCEVLTGKPPYVGRSSEEVRRKACNGDLADARARLDRCGADAELVVLTKTCLAAEAIDRPQDAQAVADGLTAYLNGVQERLHQAELAEAEAKAKAVEEAKRRRLTLALAATVLLALTLGGGGWLWVKNEHDARAAQVAREVNDALNQATALREKAKAATTGGAALFAQAREQVARARALVDNGPADLALMAQVRELQDDLDEEEKDRKLVAALDAARLAQAETVADVSRFAEERAVPKFREAFAAYGLPAGEGEPKAAAQRIRQRPAAVREAMLAALEEWEALTADAKLKIAEPHQEWLRAVLETAEPSQGWTRRFRAARDEKDDGKRKRALEKLTEEEVGALPVRALTRLAGQLDKVEAYTAAAQWLRRAQRQHPADFWVNELLGMALQKVTPPEWGEAVRFLTAAVALRPDTPGAHNNLGNALEDKGEVDAAIACYHKAIELDRKYMAAHNNLGYALHRKGQTDEAIACYRKAIALDPMVAVVHRNLGAALNDKGQVDEAIACFRKTVELTPKEAAAHLELGIVLFRKGQVEEAIACYRKAIDLDPKLARAHSKLGLALADKGQLDESHRNLGTALADKGQLDEAIACFRKTVELTPKEAAAHSNLGNALRIKGQVDEAIACCKKAIELDPNFAAAHYNLGHALNDKGQAEEAIACYQKAVALDPKNAPAHYNLALAHQRQGQLDEAIACYRKAIQLDPKEAKVHSNLGNLLKDKGQVDEAITCFRKAIELDPKLGALHFNLGNALQGKGQVDEAIACFRKAIALDPKLAVAHSNLGSALKRKGQLDEGIACLRKAIELDPKLAPAHSDLGSALRGKGKVDEAIACYKKAIELNPKNLGAYNNLGVALFDKGQVDEAIPCYRKAIALDPMLATTHRNLGDALKAKGKVDEAIASYQKAIALDPKDAKAHNNLGLVYCEVRRDYDEAIACFRKAIVLDPKHAGAHYNLGNTLRDKGQVDDAMACYKNAIALSPKFAEAHCNLGHALGRQGRFAESLEALRRGHELGSKQPGWPYPSAAWVRRAQQLAALEAKVPAFLKGEFQPKDTAEGLALVAVCQGKKLHTAAARLYADAFAADPRLADDRRAPHRYNAARLAALAAAGQGEDAVKLDDAAKAKLRGQALDWLKAELAVWSKLLDSVPPPARMQIAKVLSHWRNDADLAGIREAAALKKLPAEERAACIKLWADAAALRKKAEAQAGKVVGPIHEVGQGLKLRGQLDGPTPALVYQVKLAAGKTYVIDMVSPDQKALDPYLVLSDDAGNKLAEDDDSGGGLNARIIFRVPQDGTYRIRATSFNGGRGDFTLSVREQVQKEGKR
jgi:serine/threonine-protein kinase